MTISGLLFPLFFVLGSIIVHASTTSLEEAILRDIIGDILLDNESTGKCDPNAASGTFTANFDFGEPYVDSLLYEQEEELFLAELSHVDVLPEKSWTIRIGKGGNIYSYNGPIGEIMPPNRLEGQYMVDEVWQTVSVDTDLNNSTNDYPNGKYFIHQAGIYQKDDEPYATTSPFFYSPSIAHHCSNRECIFASWGQHAHIPTKFISKAIYVNRYRDCGDGVLEFTTVIHNADNNLAADLSDYAIDHSAETRFNYISFPWFGVKQSLYPDVMIKAGEGYDSEYVSQTPPPLYGSATKVSMVDSGGFSLFSEGHLEPPDTFTLPGYWDGGTETPTFVLGDIGNGVPCAAFASHSHYYQAYHVRCLLETDVTYTSRCPGCKVTLTNLDTGNELLVENINHFSYLIGEQYCMYFLPAVGVTDERWYSDGTGYNETAAQEVVDYVNQVLTVGAEFDIKWTQPGLVVDGVDEGHVLAFVHGIDDEITNWDSGGSITRFWNGYGMVEYGTAYNFYRNFMVYNEVNFIQLDPGTTFGRNQYIITNKGLSNTDLDAQEFVASAIQDYNLPGELPSTTIDLYLSSDASTFGAVIDNSIGCEGIAVCSGHSTAQSEANIGFTLPHFQVTCGSRTYFGPDVNYFFDFDADGVIRTYICDENDLTVRPEVKLLGFFAEGDCMAFEAAVYDESYCTTDGAPQPSAAPIVVTSDPSLSPTLVPTLSTTAVPTPFPTSEPSALPTFSPTLATTPSPTLSYTAIPSKAIIVTLDPSLSPTLVPTLSPTTLPTPSPSSEPSLLPTFRPTLSKTSSPTLLHTVVPSKSITNEPEPTTPLPTSEPSLFPTFPPTLSATSKLTSNMPSKGNRNEDSQMPSVAASGLLSLTTNFQGNKKTFGNMFHISTTHDISILTFDLHIKRRKWVDVEIYTKRGTSYAPQSTNPSSSKRGPFYVPHSKNPSSWTRICRHRIKSQGRGIPTEIPTDAIIPIDIMAGSVQSFYITLVGNEFMMTNDLDKNADPTAPVTELNGVSIYPGTAPAYYFQEEEFERATVWNGNVHFRVGKLYDSRKRNGSWSGLEDFVQRRLRS